MLELKQIHKYYYLESQTVKALKGIDITFRKNEFVSVLGPSGCGKTTLLNLIGGLDKYTSGDLVINGKSTKDFNDKDWDSYRNHSIGFVFQNYNLIPHLTVLENVELALTLSGVSKSERKSRAAQVLQKVGLDDKLKSKPNQLSGGQMQRVAIARALINNPEILLADEPTGALDTKTSEQIMDILKEISKERLIIMVTHNSEIANKYSSRIIKLLDGELIDDSNAYEGKAMPRTEQKETEKKAKVKQKSSKTSMSFLTALQLSFKNLLTKKARTFLIALAGSIGIIGIALILALSSGFQGYINKVQNDTLSTYPLSIERENIDLEGLLTIMQNNGEGEEFERETDKIYSNDIMIKMFETVMSQIHSNNLKDFKKHIDKNREQLSQYLTDIKYGYDVDLQIYSIKDNDSVMQINPSKIFQQTLPQEAMSPFMGMNFNIWTQMIDNQQVLESQYDLLDGSWPKSYDEVVVVVDKNNQINDFTLYALGIKDQAELAGILMKITNGEPLDYPSTVLDYDDILNLDYSLILPTDYYQKDTAEGSETFGAYIDMTNDNAYLKNKIENGIKLKVTGIIRPNEEAAATSIGGTVGYTSELTDYYINAINNTDIANQQKENQDIDIFSGKTFWQLQIEEIDQYIIDNNKPDDLEKDDNQKFKDYASKV
ncbi:MAG: ABC transporter ATP-binding protein, partial [Clostridia bacterium]|nr:ABC transporter ATP-binding protein [Clostridia bacterium]